MIDVLIIINTILGITLTSVKIVSVVMNFVHNKKNNRPK
jgi:hypothetical protein